MQGDMIGIKKCDSKAPPLSTNGRAEIDREVPMNNCFAKIGKISENSKR